jgi:hypothetical protein
LNESPTPTASPSPPVVETTTKIELTFAVPLLEVIEEGKKDTVDNDEDDGNDQNNQGDAP